jgi:hypothetical protein
VLFASVPMTHRISQEQIRDALRAMKEKRRRIAEGGSGSEVPPRSAPLQPHRPDDSVQRLLDRAAEHGSSRARATKKSHKRKNRHHRHRRARNPCTDPLPPIPEESELEKLMEVSF